MKILPKNFREEQMKFMCIGEPGKSFSAELHLSIWGPFTSMLYLSIRLFFGSLLIPLAWALKKNIYFGVQIFRD